MIKRVSAAEPLRAWLIPATVALTAVFVLTTNARQPVPARLTTRHGTRLSSTTQLPVRLSLADSGFVTVDVAESRSIALGIARIALSGDAVFVVDDGSRTHVARYNSASSPRCFPLRPDTRECRIPLRFSQGARLAIAPAGPNGVRLDTLEVFVAREARKAAFAVGAFGIVLFVLAALLVGSVALQRRVAASQWLLVAGTTGALGVTAPRALVVMAPGCVLAWIVSKNLRNAQVGTAGGLPLILGCLGAVLLLVGAKVTRDIPFAPWSAAPLGLPLGISYFTIKILDAFLEWHRGRHRDISFREFAAYLFFLPTIPAGPIHSLDDFRGGRLGVGDVAQYARAGRRIVIGLFKKLLIADMVLAPLLFAPQSGMVDRVVVDPGAATWVAIGGTLFLSFAYAYIDFSAYSDIAIGAGRFLGYRVPENFNFPFLATSVREFWRRWHMSLSSWCMRNIFLPVAIWTRRAHQPSYVVMVVIGLWHAVNASWIAWAMHHGSGLAISGARQRRAPRQMRMPKWIALGAGIAGTLAFVAAGHAFVLVDDFPTALHLYARFWTLGLIP